MGLMVDPKKDGEGSSFVGAGRKLAMAVGMNRWAAKKGTPMMTMGFVVLKDANDGADNGKVFMERFALTQAALFRIARWANATGWAEPFDATNDEHIQRIMARGPVVAVLKMETYDGKDRAAVDSFDPYSGNADPSWDAMTTKGEQEFQRIQLAMESKRGGGGGSDHPNAPGNGGAPAADIIPF